MLNALGIVWLVAALAMAAVWALQVRTRNAGFVDVAWAALLGLAALYYGLVADTINVARDIGLSLYNDMVLMTPVGSVRLTVTRQFNQSRKIGRIHQYVLVFTKGDGRRAADRLNADNEVTGPRVERDPVEESQAAEVYETPEDWWSQ